MWEIDFGDEVRIFDEGVVGVVEGGGEKLLGK